MIKKHNISKASYQMLFDYLAGFLKMENRAFYTHLIKTLTGYWCKTEEELHKEGKIIKKTWFIIKGLIYLHFTDRSGDRVVFMLFRAGENAIIPDSFMNGAPSTCYLTACIDTELLETSRSDMSQIRELFPQSLALENAMLAKITEKHRERDELICLEAEQRIVEFFTIYHELHPYYKTVKMHDKDIASYLHMDRFNFCKLKNKLYPKNR